MIHKPVKIVSKKIRQAAKGQTCTIRDIGCEGSGTVVFAHINSPYKGVGNKSPDLFGCDACYSCHNRLDSGKVSHRDQLRAMQETLMRRYEQGLIEVAK